MFKIFARKMFLYFLNSLIVFIFWSIEISETKIYFNTLKEEFSRATIHEPYVLDKTCMLKPDVGPCRAEIAMYYFEPSTRSCSAFLWGGCQGNGNRFDSNRECMETCLSRPNLPKTRPKWCSLTFDYGFCFGAIKRWYYDALWKTCKERIYSGCGGNKNNFYNKEQCDAICRFSNGPITMYTSRKTNSKKFLIVDPLGSTSRKGRNQSLYQSTHEAKKIITLQTTQHTIS